MQRKWIPLVALIPAIVLITAIQAWSATIVFDISDAYIEVDETFSVDVYAQEEAAIGELTSFGFDVEDVPLLIYTGYGVAAFDWVDTGYNTNTDLDASYVAGFWSDPFATNAGSSILLSTLNFTAGSSAGTTTLSIRGIYDNWDHGAYYDVAGQDILGTLDITIHGATATVPEPGSALLLGLGMAGIAGLLRKPEKRLS